MAYLLITGAPGVGKTTLIQKIVQRLTSEPSLNVRGFYTEEIRGTTGIREGFDVVSIDGKIRAPLSRVFSLLRGPKVGKYVVNVPKFEEVALPLLALDNDSSRRQTVFVVDEIGKMEVTSKSFVRAIQKIIESNLPLVATVAEKGSGFIEEIKAQGNIYTVTKANRNEMVDIVYRDLQHMLNLKQT